jgi:L-iditol 2-dehydrogenase
MMKALVCRGPKNISYMEVPKPKAEDNEVIIKVEYAGVCGTDLRIYEGTKEIPYPRIIGHELSGVIHEKGKHVQDFSCGDRVAVYPMLACGECYVCRQGRTNICVHRKTIGYEIDGAFAEFVKIPASFIEAGNVVKVPDGVTFEQAAIAEPLTAALHGIDRAHLEKGQFLAIVGAGPIGLAHLQLALSYDVECIVIEPAEERRALARKLGADYIIDPKSQDLFEKIKEITEGVGVHVAMVDVGIPQVIESSLHIIRKGGVCVIFAGSPKGSSMTIDPNFIHYNEIDLIGSSSSSPDNMNRILSMIEDGKLNTELLISDVYPMKEWEKALGKKKNYQGVKTLLFPEHSE